MDGYFIPKILDDSIRRLIPTVLRNRIIDTDIPRSQDTFRIGNGCITLWPRDPIDFFYASEECHFISFSLDTSAEIETSIGPEAPRDTTLLPGRIHFHPAGKPVYLQYPARSMQLVSIGISKTIVDRIRSAMKIEKSELTPKYNLQTPLSETLGVRLRDFMSNHQPGGVVVGQSLAILAIHEVLAASFNGVYRSTVSVQTLEASPMRRALDFIEANIERDISLNDIAEIACKSPFHFARVFKSTVGLTPVAYVIERRIVRAKEMLSQSNTPISTIATRCGFNSQSHFCRTFKRITDQSPRSYRRLNQGVH